MQLRLKLRVLKLKQLPNYPITKAVQAVTVWSQTGEGLEGEEAELLIARATSYQDLRNFHLALADSNRAISLSSKTFKC